MFEFFIQGVSCAFQEILEKIWVKFIFNDDNLPQT